MKKLLKNNSDQRLLSNDLQKFEEELRRRIENGQIKYLSIADENQFLVKGIIEIE